MFKENLISRKYLVALFIGVLTTILFYSDFPLPHGDDLFFVGTSVHYAETGNFLNPGVYDYTEQFSEVQNRTGLFLFTCVYSVYGSVLPIFQILQSAYMYFFA